MGERIAQLRRNKGLSQATLAQALGLSTSTIAMYEQGRREPSVSVIIALADALGVTIDYLLTGHPPQESPFLPTTATARSHLIATLLSTAVHLEK